MSTNEEKQRQRAQALDMALRTPSIHGGSDALKLAAAYEKYIVGDAADHVSATASNLETFTFDQFVQYGRDRYPDAGSGMPWSFYFRGHPVTHENDRCYLIGVNATQLRFTADDFLVVNPDGSLATIKAAPVQL